MSLTAPTTQQINDNIIAQLESSLGQTIPLLPKSFLRVLAKTLAGVFILLYKYAGFMFLQMFVRTASYAPTAVNGVIINPLQEWGRLIGVTDLIPATQAELNITITVQNQTGTLPAGTQFVGPSNGVTYVLKVGVALNAATVPAVVRAASDQNDTQGAGTIGNLSAGAVLSFANPVANVARSAVVASQAVTGTDAEPVETYRQRIVDRFQKQPQGGAYADYELWGETVPGIVNVYPYTAAYPGQVDVYVEATPASSGSPDGIPTNAQLQAVLDAIEFDENGLASRRPANALVNAFPITRSPFTVTVNDLVVEDVAEAEAAVTEAVQEYFLSRAPYIAGLTVPPRTDRITYSGVNGTIDRVVSQLGGIYSVAVVEDGGGSNVGVYSLGQGEKAKATVVFA